MNEMIKEQPVQTSQEFDQHQQLKLQHFTMGEHEGSLGSNRPKTANQMYHRSKLKMKKRQQEMARMQQSHHNSKEKLQQILGETNGSPIRITSMTSNVHPDAALREERLMKMNKPIFIISPVSVPQWKTPSGFVMRGQQMEHAKNARSLQSPSMQYDYDQTPDFQGPHRQRVIIHENQ
mmetsp:Transcript_39522/g.60337  ORF Transcript_39522/g.60337 Transcript_39522/m.60337 type:complete len:178 (+) Transcript_39522:1068-1601(+)